MEEWFDVCDLEGVPTGEVVTRSQAHAQGICHRTAHVWICRKGENGVEVLLQKRSQEKDSFPGQYDTSSAGHIQAGHLPAESAIRELSEELGLTAREADLVPIGKFLVDYQEVFHGKPFLDKEIAFVFLYRGEVDEKDLTLQEEEIESVRWFPLEEVVSGVERGEERFCVPPGGLALLKRHFQEAAGDEG